MRNLAIQFTSMLAAALLGEYVMLKLIGISMSFTHLWVSAAHWSAAGLAYLIPRSATRSLRNRILGSLLIISALAVASIWFAHQFLVPVGMLAILAPFPALLVFCVAAFLTNPPRLPSRLGIVLLVSVAVQFLCTWWAYGFNTDLLCRLAAPRVIPFLAATATLLTTDNLIKIGENPTKT